MDLDALLRALGYLNSKRHWVTLEKADSRLAHHYRLAQRAGEEAGSGANVVGNYVYQTSLENKLLPPRPAVFVAHAENDDQARDIHKCLWNLGDCPFVIVVLPSVVRVYTGFDYSSDDPKRTIIATAPNSLFQTLPGSLAPFAAEAIDTGRIWKEQAKHLGSDKRVDYRLLTNLKELSRLLQANHSVSRKTAHALIGKYIYFRYLRDRGILDDAWLKEHNIRPEDVFGRAATPQGFEALAQALQKRFNGDIFPLPLEDDGHWRSNDAVPFVARTFHGDSPAGQMVLDFGVYDFSYIPVELLSSVYEQFLKDEGGGEGDGVVYTPEALTDYILAELEEAHPLRSDHKVLDPCCGSGIFLVLAYRRLIEKLWHEQGERPTAEAMKRLLQENICGVEKDQEACHITAFSLILTLLSHLEPPELQANASFQFPTLVNESIFHADFFSSDCPVFQGSRSFDWVVGNPPWTGADAKNPEHQVALAWIHKAEEKGQQVGERRLDEAFTWRVGDLLGEAGYAGLLIKATTLVNSSSAEYRRGFFKSHDVRRITNFSNLRRILFMGPEGKRAEAPAISLVYKNSSGERKLPILHFGPFVVDQIPVRSKGGQRRIWTIALYESDVQHIDYTDAEEDVPCLWKTALWGSFQDRRSLRRLSRVLPRTLGEIVNEKGWLMCSGPHIKARKGSSKGTFIPASELKDRRIFETNLVSTKFSVAEDELPLLESERQFIEKRKGPKGLRLIVAPHLLISAEVAIYSDRDFVIPAPKVGIAVPQKDAEHLKAIALYLNSSVARYAHFFNSALWGIYIGTVNPENVGAIPCADLTPEQIKKMSSAYDAFAEQERSYVAQHAPLVGPPLDLRGDVDAVIEETLQIPKDVSMAAHDFMRVRYQLLEGKLGKSASEPAAKHELKAYAEQLRLQVDDFAQRHHQVTVRAGQEAIIATVEVTSEASALAVRIIEREESVGRAILNAVQEEHSQWAYIQRSVQIFEGTCVHIVKSARLLDWTQTQAIQDAANLISEVLDRTASRYAQATA